MIQILIRSFCKQILKWCNGLAQFKNFVLFFCIRKFMPKTQMAEFSFISKEIQTLKTVIKENDLR